MKDKNLYIVTEVGTFGNLDINDPTIKKVKGKNNQEMTEEELTNIINTSIQNNSNIKV